MLRLRLMLLRSCRTPRLFTLTTLLTTASCELLLCSCSCYCYNYCYTATAILPQERMLGIDRERFYNVARSASVSEEGGGGSSTLRDWGLRTVGLRCASGGTKHPCHLMRDIVDVSLGREHPCAFTCVFKMPLELSRRKEYHYEAASNHEAAEIVAKISYLMQLHAKGASVKDATSRSRRDTVRTKWLGSSRV